MQVMAWFSAGQLDLIPLVANRFLEQMGEVTIGCAPARSGPDRRRAIVKVPDGHPDRAFYEGKRHAAHYWANTVLSTCPLGTVAGRCDTAHGHPTKPSLRV